MRADDDELIRRVANTAGQAVTDFLTASTAERAHDVLADQRNLRPR